MMQYLRRNWFTVSKSTWAIWRILTQVLKSLKNLHFNGLLLNKVYNVWAKKVQKSYVWWHWRLMQNLKENWLVLSNNTINKTFYTCSTESLFLRSKETCENKWFSSMFSIYISRRWWLFLKNWFKNFVKQYHAELSWKAWSHNWK